MNTKSLTSARVVLLLLAAAVPFGAACSSSDAPSSPPAGGAPAGGGSSAGAPGAGAPSAGAPSAGAPSAGAPSAGAPSGGAGGASAGAGGTSNAGAGGAHGGAGGAAGSSGASGAGGGSSGGFALTSPDQAEGMKFGTAYTCAAMNGMFGAGVNPELNWSGAPAGTMSYAITFIDTTIGDANQMGRHWAIWNIPSTVTKFPKGTKTLSGDLAAAKQSGSFLTPCAQTVMNGMDDNYEFTVWAVPSATLTVTGSGDSSIVNLLSQLRALSPAPAKATLHGHAGVKGA
ncbi:MAG: hypothetical protein ABW061_18475 [Polyangiaceae bacterium]